MAYLLLLLKITCCYDVPVIVVSNYLLPSVVLDQRPFDKIILALHILGISYCFSLKFLIKLYFFITGMM